MESNFKNLLYESFDNKKRLIIIDWDDTLLPTYWIHLNEENNKCVSIIDHDLKIKYFLDKCQNYGKVIIITNSSSNWIGSTSKNYLSK